MELETLSSVEDKGRTCKLDWSGHRKIVSGHCLKPGNHMDSVGVRCGYPQLRRNMKGWRLI